MSTSNVENLAPCVIRRVAKELTELIKQPLEGIQLLPNEEDVSDIQAIIEGPAGTPYQGGWFKVKLVLGKAFPVSPPKGYFLTKIFHPNVARNGEICVNTLKKDWQQDLGIKHLFLVIKCLLIEPNPESALNEDAAKLLLEHYDEYCDRAKMITEIHAKAPPSKELKCLVREVPDECQQQRALQSNINRRPLEGEAQGSMAKKQALKPNVARPVGSSLYKAGSAAARDKKKALKRL